MRKRSSLVDLEVRARLWRRVAQLFGMLLALWCCSPAHAVYSVRDCATCPEMVVLQPGEFMMGSPLSEALRDPDEGPQHRVRVGYSIGVAQYKVTRGEYAAFVQATGHPDGDGCWVWDNSSGRFEKDATRSWRNPGFEQTDQHPVVCVSWQDAKAYAAWLSQKAGQPYRLLSEAEWEYAARAGSTGARPWGDDVAAACRYANVADQTAAREVLRIPVWVECSDGYAYTSPVGAFLPNAFGLYDTMGDAWEWVEDCYHDSYERAPNDGRPWVERDCTERVFRGGGWDNYPRNIRSAYRYRAGSETRSSSTGFRIGRTLP
jgi:formylglycine-generating enzyme